MLYKSRSDVRWKESSRGVFCKILRQTRKPQGSDATRGHNHTKKDAAPGICWWPPTRPGLQAVSGGIIEAAASTPAELRACRPQLTASLSPSRNDLIRSAILLSGLWAASSQSRSVRAETPSFAMYWITVSFNSSRRCRIRGPIASAESSPDPAALPPTPPAYTERVPSRKGPEYKKPLRKRAVA
jgi:hypothetical protein